MNEFDGSGGIVRGGQIAAYCKCAAVCENWANAFAAAETGIAHSLKQGSAGYLCIERYAETLVDTLLALLQKFGRLEGIRRAHRLGLFFDFV